MISSMYNTKNNLLFSSQIFLVLFSAMFYLNYGNLISYYNYAIIIAYLLLIIVIIISIIINGIDLITLMLICSELILIPLSIQYFTGTSYGLLGLNLYPIYLPEILTIMYLYSTTLVFLSAFFNFSLKEKSLIKTGGLVLNQTAVMINNIIAILFVIIAFPRLGMVSNGNARFDMLLPGHSWNQLAIVALLFNFRYLKSNLSVKMTYIFVVSWFLIDGERADVAGLILGLSIMYLQKRGKKSSWISIFLLCSLLITFIILLNFIVVVRNNESYSVKNIVGGIFTTATLSDVGYLCNISIDYWNKFGGLRGTLIRSNFLSAIPFLDPFDFTKFIDSIHYPNPGGESVFSEPLIDFGLIGLPFVATLDFLIYRLILQFDNKFFYYEYLIILCSIPRIVWYGRSYFYSSVLFFVPMMFILNSFISKHIEIFQRRR
ncbi:hypothetical protein [Limosilactobacillus reuteri]|uniref:hypothetical protein n=1 Tax=Limosilactobacillus reuteri TaxID=1598 RepID=UPI0036D2FCCA